MKVSEIQDRIIDFQEGTEIVGKELEWILDVVNQKDPKQGDPLAEEMIGKFYSLYNDLIRIRYEMMKTMKQILLIENSRFPTTESKKIYINTIEDLLKLTSSGRFARFISVAETGKLPPKS